MTNPETEVDTEGVQKLVGRTIVAAHRAPPSKESWPLLDQTLTLTLDDGSVWRFEGDGYDSSSLLIYVSENCATAPNSPNSIREQTDVAT